MSDRPRTTRCSIPAAQPFPVLLGFDLEFQESLRKSLQCGDSLHSDQFVDDWIAERLSSPRLKVTKIPLKKIRNWRINGVTGNIEHDSGMFFYITGLTVRHRTPVGVLNWDQPIIDQPEIGILGILAKQIDGVLHFCLQAKEEPGNINSVQLSPTVQATYSNYTRVHGGNSPPFLEQFLSPPRDKIIYAKLQTEDGGRFLYKSNRNMIVLADETVDNDDLPTQFIWLTLKQISRIYQRDNLIHACTRSILAALHPTTSQYSNAAEDFSLIDVVQWLDDKKSQNHFLAKREGLKLLQDWHLDPKGYFSHKERRFFKVIGIDVTSLGREISAWTQPILVNPESGIIGLLVRNLNGQRYFLMQAKAEVGNRSVIQLGPTVQFTPVNYIDNLRLAKPFLFDEFSNPGRFAVLFQSHQSEEGARFFKESHLHRILELPADDELNIPFGFRWISESELNFFIHFGEQVNSCARSIISCLLGGQFGRANG